MKEYKLNGEYFKIEIGDDFEFKYFQYLPPFDLHFGGEWVKTTKENFLEALDKELEWLYNKTEDYQKLKERITNNP